MKDPMVLAFDVRRPWPNVRAQSIRANRSRWEIKWSPFWQVAGRECYFPALVSVWHVDPSGYDSDERCAISFLRDAQGRIVKGENGEAKLAWAWRFHVHHWHVQVRPLQALRRRLFTRCSWCGGRHAKREPVNVSAQWDHEKTPWWQGEKGLFHMNCQSAEHAARSCTCDDPLPERGESGPCLLCGLFRAWRPEPWVLENTRDYKTVPHGEKPSPELIERVVARATAGRAAEGQS